MTHKLFLFEWNEDSAEARAALLRADGWEVETESIDGARGVKRVAEWGPDVVVLDLFFKASHSRESAAALTSRSITRDIPIAFLDGLPGVVEKMLAQVKGAIAVSSFELSSALNDLVPGD
jgi:DNA-binding response OmpR family regulator